MPLEDEINYVRMFDDNQTGPTLAGNVIHTYSHQNLWTIHILSSAFGSIPATPDHPSFHLVNQGKKGFHNISNEAKVLVVCTIPFSYFQLSSTKGVISADTGKCLIASVLCNGVDEAVKVIREEGHAVAVAVNLLGSADSVQVVHVDAVGVATLDAQDAELAVLASALVGAGGAVVIEERVQTSAVDEDALRVDDSETPAEFAVCGLALAGSVEVGVVQG